MDYYQLGQQIRKYRKVHGMSQEQLAEKIGISVTHMSHIETGNTKLSLQVFVDITRALDISGSQRSVCRYISRFRYMRRSGGKNPDGYGQVHENFT